MDLKDFKFHHIGLGLKKEDQALKFLSAQGYAASDKIYDPEQDVNLRILTCEGRPTIEFVMPGQNPDGPLKAILKHHNELMYHTCYEVDDLEAALKSLEDQGFRAFPVAPRKPAILFGGRHVSFYNIIGFGIIELLEPV